MLSYIWFTLLTVMAWTLVYADAHISNRHLSMRIVLSVLTHVRLLMLLQLIAQFGWLQQQGLIFSELRELQVQDQSAQSVLWRFLAGRWLPLPVISHGWRRVWGSPEPLLTKTLVLLNQGPHPYDFCNLICLLSAPSPNTVT